MRRAFKRSAVPQPAASRSMDYTFPAPVRGWVTNQNLITQSPGSAIVLDNWFPTQQGVRMRRGTARWITIGSSPVLSLMTYVSGGQRLMFAADETGIYNVTSSSSEPASSVVSGQTSGRYSTAMVSTVGGNYLYAVNGSDDALLFDGSSWDEIDSTSEPISITGVDTSDLMDVWTHRNRLFFIQNNSLRAWFLPPGQVGGAALDLFLGAVFTKGGSLLFGATWSLDAGDGLDDKCAFVTAEGEVAVYQGSDPGDAQDWFLVGVYDVGRPLGPDAYIRAGGDLLIATDRGVIPLNAAIQRDRASLGLASLSAPIDTEWRQEVFARGAVPWPMLKHDDGPMVIVGLPVVGSAPPRAFVANIETGAWAQWTGCDVNCLAMHQGGAFFGTADGRIMRFETGGDDDGQPYICRLGYAFSELRSQGAFKVVKLVRASFRASTMFIPQVSGSADWTTDFPSPPGSAQTTQADVWDVGLWDEAFWDAGAERRISTRWVSVARAGFAFSPQVQISSDTDSAPDVELIAVGVVYETGGLVV